MGLNRTLRTLGLLLGMLALGAAPAPAAIRAGEVVVAGSHEFDALIVVNPATGKQRLFAANGAPVNSGSQFLETPTDVVISPRGQLFVADAGNLDGSGGVVAVDPRTGRQTEISSNDQPVNATSQHFDVPTGIALLPSGELLVVDRGASAVIAVDPATGKQRVFSSNDQPANMDTSFFSDLRGGITVMRSGLVLVGNSGPVRGVIALDPDSGEQSRFSTNDQPVNASSQLYTIPVGVAETISGKVLVADQNGPNTLPGYFNGGVIGVNPATGGQSRVSDNEQQANASSSYFADPFDLTFGLSGRLFVLDASAFSGDDCSGADPGCGGLISVDPASGKERVLSSNDQAINAPSQFFEDELGLDVMPPRCKGRVATIYGSPAGERIRGTPRADVIAALGGRDAASGLGGKDLICGGRGSDVLRGGRGRDRLLGEGGNDGLFGGGGRDRLAGGKGRDLLRGGAGRDRQRQ